MAISILDEAEAEEVFQYLAEVGQPAGDPLGTDKEEAG